MTFKLKAASAAVLVAAFIAPATAQTLYGGGATLPAIAYVGTSWEAATPQARLSNPADAGSLFGAFSAQTVPVFRQPLPFPTVSYCQTGSGGGRNVYIGTAAAVAPNPPVATPATNLCGDYGSGTQPNPRGFEAPTVRPNFAATDAPLSSAEYARYQTNNTAVTDTPVQVPSIAGNIAISYHNADVPGTFFKQFLNLSEAQICGIFAGTITNWDQIANPAGGFFPTKQISIVVRNDSSGTSFAFTNHLSSVCAGTAASHFSTQSTFSPAAFPGGVLPATPAVVINNAGTSGNGGVVNTIVATDGAIGYAEIADTVERAALLPQPNNQRILRYTTVSRTSGGKVFSPAKSAETFPIASGTLAYDTVLNGVNATTGRPVLQTLTAAGLTPAPGKRNCVILAAPDSYATSPLKGSDYSRYPILAVTYLLAAGAGNGSNTAAVQSLMNSPFDLGLRSGAITPTTASPITRVGANTGFSFLEGVVGRTDAGVDTKIQKALGYSTANKAIPGCIGQ